MSWIEGTLQVREEEVLFLYQMVAELARVWWTADWSKFWRIRLQSRRPEPAAGEILIDSPSVTAAPFRRQRGEVLDKSHDVTYCTGYIVQRTEETGPQARLLSDLVNSG